MTLDPEISVRPTTALIVSTSTTSLTTKSPSLELELFNILKEFPTTNPCPVEVLTVKTSSVQAVDPILTEGPRSRIYCPA